MAWISLGLAILVCAAGAHADTERTPEVRERWSASISAAMGVWYQQTDATVASDLRGEAPRNDNTVMSMVPLGVQLAGPTISAIPGSPRPFFHGEYQLSLDTDRTLAREGVPGTIVVPEMVGSGQQPDEIPGQGQELEGTFKNQWVAGIGLAFPLMIEGRRVELKPSLDYMGRYVEFDASLSDLRCADGGDDCRGNVDNPPNQALWGEPTHISGESDEIFHAFGPRFAIEVDAGRRGPIGVSVFLSAQVYFFLDGGDADDTYTNADGDELRWEYDPDPYVIQGAAGVRFTWKGR